MTLHRVRGGVVEREGLGPVALERTLAQSGVHLVFKHSPACFVSARARRQVGAFADRRPELEIYEVDVLVDRATSLALEERYRVVHESPQAILIHDGEVAWHASHGAITAEALVRATNDVLAGKGADERPADGDQAMIHGGEKP